jgi:hypothetical protein
LTDYIDTKSSQEAGAQLNASTLYTNQRRLMGVTGTWTVTGRNTFTWSAFTASMADTNKAVSAGSYSGGTNGRRFFYIDITAPATLQNIADPSTLGANHVLIAIFEPGVTGGGAQGTLTILGGTTWIGGDQIITDSIIGNRIKVNQINAGHIIAQQISSDKMNVNDLSAMRGTFAAMNTGNLTVNGNLALNTTGKFYSGTKSTFASAVAGFFLGYDGGYKFNVGDGNNKLTWNGTTLAIATDSPIAVTASGANRAVFALDDGAGNSSYIGFTGGEVSTPNFRAQSLTGDNVYSANLYMDASLYGSPHNMITFVLATATRHLTFDNAGVLSYDGNMVVNGSFITSGTIIANTNNIRIAAPFTPSNHSGPAGTTGDIRWDSNFIYVWVGDQWKRATLNFF